MFKQTPIRLQLSSASLRNTLDEIWRRYGVQKSRKVGLAISGGVDSMALAYLCSSMKPRALSFQAFVVDHKLRSESTGEAQRVCDNLGKLGLRSKILTLDWTDQPIPSSGLETIARRLRYQALGAACVDAGISSLLLAHHADDQAETILTRIASKQLGAGLAGIRQHNQIPECGSLYGAHQSATPKSLRSAYTAVADVNPQHVVAPSKKAMLVESGGVRVIRPLLGQSKDELIAVCKESNVPWFEDETNKDRTLTMRNTVRDLLASEKLPLALRSSRLRSMGQKSHDRKHILDLDAQKLFARLELKLELRAGRAVCTIPAEVLGALQVPEDACYLQSAVFRLILETVAPRQSVALRDIQDVAQSIFSPEQATLGPATVAGVYIYATQRVSGDRVLDLHRTPPTAMESRKALEELISLSSDRQDSRGRTWSRWHLWDNRYWISLSAPRRLQRLSSRNVSIGFLSAIELGKLRRDLGNPNRGRLEVSLRCTKGSSRFIIPAVFVDKECVALPSIDWCLSEFKGDGKQDYDASWLCETRYKSLNESLVEDIETRNRAPSRA